MVERRTVRTVVLHTVRIGRALSAKPIFRGCVSINQSKKKKKKDA
jgi:hypothetical protein